MNQLRRVGLLLAVAFALLVPAAGQAAPLQERDVPEPLRPWTSWVLAGAETSRCPALPGAPDDVRCVWPAKLSLDLDEHGGRFEQRFHVDAPAWVPLPGDEGHFPLEVKASGERLVTVVREGIPSVRLDPGDHAITGAFAWDTLPDSLAIPGATGIVELRLSGQRVAEPARDGGGRVFLQQTARAEEGERLDILVHRRITDDVPLGLVTRVVLDVAGKSREVVLGRSLPPGFVPMSIVADLPARIEADSRLRVQVRPGTFTIELSARSEGPVAELGRPAPDGPWRDGEEVWVFDARPALRLVSVEGVHAIDPQQTSLPDAWKSLPAYAVGPGDRMILAEKRRGDAEPEPDQLSLERSLWLDFDGRGFTAKDTIAGTLHRATRLEMNPETALGRVALDGRDQFITTGTSGKAGVEIRQGDLRITADSRIVSSPRDIPAVGYDHDFHGVTETLHLPPGYRLFHVAGADEVPGTWIRHWTLLDLFLVLVLALAFGKLYGRNWGLLALGTFVLAFPEADAPQWIWPFALAAVALVRVMPDGRARRFFVFVELAVLAGLAVLTLPFVVQHVREGIYPALADHGGWQDEAPLEALTGGAGVADDVAEEVAAQRLDAPPPAAPAAQEMKQLAPSSLPELPKAKSAVSPSRRYRAEAYDPSAMVQTGPGLPTWRWAETDIRFSGPVDREQRLHLYLMPPGLNLLLALVRAALLALVFVRLLPGGTWASGLRGVAGGAALLAVLLAPSPARAEVPPQELLDQLRARLLEKPDCAPACAASPRMLLEVKGGALRARLEVAAAATTAVPLPGSVAQWTPARVMVDGKEASGLVRTPDGLLMLRVEPGLHDVTIEGPLPARESVQLALPLKPHHVEAKVDGYLLEGLHEDGVADEHLQLTRKQAATEPEGAGALAAGVLPAFVTVERTLHVGLSWKSTTRVVRVTPTGTAVVLEVPLLPGESVTTAGVRVSAGKALVNMPPDATEATWTSVLEERSPVALAAPRTTAWVEVWRLDVSPIWHATPSGLAVVHGEAGSRIPEWRPWPGETLSIELVRPPGVPGQTLTIDRSTYEVRPGLRAMDGTLQFRARSSRGTEHTVKLPEGAELESVTVNGASQPLRHRGADVTLPISPGAQEVSLGFRVPTGVGTVFRVPAVDLGTPSVNATTRVQLSDSRWVLFVRGPRLGPAVLFWSLVLVLVFVSYGLGFIRWVPLARHEWMLLAIGLSQVPMPAAAVVVGWLLALGHRRERPELPVRLFDLRQLLLVVWTLAALTVLVVAVHQGLMGQPDMQIRGNGSYGGMLQWFEDRTAGVPEQPLVVSVPMLVYRGAMLAWALWLAVAVLRWLRFAWTSFSTGGLWRKKATAAASAVAPPSAPAGS